MKILSRPNEAQALTRGWKPARIAFVPTMGCLHEGHLALVRKARSVADRVVVSVFVNPLQFGPREDFEKYPRPFEQDARKCEAAGVDLLFHPAPQDLYPAGFATSVAVAGITDSLCGSSRPGHFAGVTTVCLKLFHILGPDFAVFGEKDFQQLCVLQRMAADLNLPVEIVPHPIVREADGLALSSRNRYLSADERERASAIPKAMKAAQRMAREDGMTVGPLLETGRNALGAARLTIDYLEIASERDLRPVAPTQPISSIPKPRLFAAVKAGATRLIDNARLD